MNMTFCRYVKKTETEGRMKPAKSPDWLVPGRHGNRDKNPTSYGPASFNPLHITTCLVSIAYFVM